MNLGRVDGSTVPVALDGSTDVEGDRSRTILGATDKAVALFVPVGLMLCGAVFVGTTTTGVLVRLAEETEPVTVEPEAIRMGDIESDTLAPDSEALSDKVTEAVADVAAEMLPELVPVIPVPVPVELETIRIEEIESDTLASDSEALPDEIEAISDVAVETLPELVPVLSVIVEPETITTEIPESDTLDPDSEALPDETAGVVVDAAAETLPEPVPVVPVPVSDAVIEIAEPEADTFPDIVAEF
jgi:hypothetical protein